MKKLKQELVERNISIYEMSKNTGIPYSTMNDIVNEKIRIEGVKLGNAVKIAEYLNITIEELYLYNHNETIDFIDQLGTTHTGTLYAKDGYFYLNYNLNGKEEIVKICLVNDDTTPFITDFAEWTLKKTVNSDLLERWEELL